MEIRVFLGNADGFVCAKRARACTFSVCQAIMTHLGEQNGAQMRFEGGFKRWKPSGIGSSNYRRIGLNLHSNDGAGNRAERCRLTAGCSRS